MDLYVYDENLSLAGIIDEYGSLMWIKRANSAGAFELYAPADQHNISILQAHRFVYRYDVDEAMYISTIKEAKTENGKYVTVSGYSLDGLYRKRKVPDNIDKTSLINTLERCTGFGFDVVFFDPDGYDSQTIATNDEFDTAEGYMRYVLKKLECQIVGRLNPRKNRVEFTLIKPKDISEQYVFSEDFDNMANSTYEFSEEGCYNSIYGRCVVPSGVETPNGIPKYTVGLDKVGLRSSEKVISFDPIVKTGYRYEEVVGEGDDGGGGSVLVSYEYLDYDQTFTMMKEKCDSEMRDYTENFNADILAANQYRKVFDVGYTVAIQNGFRNIRYFKKIEEVEETFDEVGYTITPTFGDPLKTIYDFIKY